MRDERIGPRDEGERDRRGGGTSVRIWSRLEQSGRRGLAAVAVTLVAVSTSAVWPMAIARAEPAREAPTDGLRVPRASTAPEDKKRGGVSEEPDLGSLLELPSGFGAVESEPTVAGSGEAEWRRRFRTGRASLTDARTRLAATKRELDSLAGEGGGQWNVAPSIGAAAGGAGAQGRDTPLSFKLRQQLKRDREAVEQAEKELRRLHIEAELAGVPRSWRGQDDPPVSTEPGEIPLR